MRPRDSRRRRSGRSAGCSSACPAIARWSSCFDDLHWAEPTFLDLIEYLAGWSRGCADPAGLSRTAGAARQAADLADGDAERDLVTLEPLSEQEAESLLDVLRGEAELSSDILASITEAAEGNPLFVEQMLAMMTTDDAPGRRDAAASIHALLAARLDRLEPDERATIERASVIGRDFWRGAVADFRARRTGLWSARC